MRKLILVLGLAFALTGVMAFHALAVPITGEISFAGNVVADNSDLSAATAFTAFNNVFVTAVTGHYSPVATGALSSPAVTFSPFVFNPPQDSIVPLWTFNYLGNTYSLESTSFDVTFASLTPGTSLSSIVIDGVGISRITGLDDTNGTWNVTANSSGTTFSFSSSSSSRGEGISIPEPSTLLLVISGILGILGFRTRFRF